MSGDALARQLRRAVAVEAEAVKRPTWARMLFEPRHMTPEALEIDARLRLGETGSWGFADGNHRVVWFAVGKTRLRLPIAPYPLPHRLYPYRQGDTMRSEIAQRVSHLLGRPDWGTVVVRFSYKTGRR